jgi:hypothetical protein
MDEAKEKILKDLRKIAQLSDDVYNISVVLESFCTSNKEIEEMLHIKPIVNTLHEKADVLNSYFVNLIVSE